MAMQAGGKTMWADEGAYPVRERLGKADESDVLVVDVGGGAGHDLLGFRARHPDLKGRLVLQEMPYMVEKAREEGACAGVVELMGHDFYGPQPVEGLFCFFHSKAFYSSSFRSRLERQRGRRRKEGEEEQQSQLTNTTHSRSARVFPPPNPARLLGRNLPPDPAADHPSHESRNFQNPDQRARATGPRRALADDLARSGADDMFGSERAHGEGVPGVVRVGWLGCEWDLEASAGV